MTKHTIKNQLTQRILILDGGMGTMIQRYSLKEDDYRGERFANWSTPLIGCNDLLVLTAPNVIGEIHREYLDAGADIILTNTFNATSISLADYGLKEYAYEINKSAAQLARSVVDGFTSECNCDDRWVVGSMGPTSHSTSISADVNNPAKREVTFKQLSEAYQEQVKGLLDGGVDAIMVETIFDTLNAKAAVFAIKSEGEIRGIDIPIMISVTVADSAGRTLSGQTVEAFYASLVHAQPMTIGLNCAFGAKQLLTHLERLANVSAYPISAHPNAGLPNLMGEYDQMPGTMALDVEEYLKRGLINVIGGCCGTTPEHIKAIAEVAKNYKPRPLPVASNKAVLSGLEPLVIAPETNFVNIGERTNVAGSAKFARLIRDQQYDEALSVARHQVEAGAQVVDVCMDDGMIDGVEAMTKFLNLAMSEPEISRVPMMIDSSVWEVLEAGLQCVQGKSIVNSISLKEGEEEFVKRAKLIRKYGAAVVVMLFDEQGQADTYARKIEVAKRAYDILVGQEFPPQDIVFDPNILAVATGISEHDTYGADFIKAIGWIKSNLPHAKICGGVSNLSFAFRGNNKVREAMHSVFLYHAIEAGMDMGIVNPSMLQVYSEIEPELLELAEDVVLNRRSDAAERLSVYAQNVTQDATTSKSQRSVDKWREESIKERIAYAMMRGVTDYVEVDILEAYKELNSPLAVIDTVLMPGMEKVGKLFGEGKMFLPQVVKSARVMRRAVDVLTPYMEQESEDAPSNAAGKVLIATVKGDVHDIGKNIVSVVMSCNGYQVKDLGVMVEREVIVENAIEWGADVIGLSGLISPSLNEMVNVVEELERRGLQIPVVIGGATTSELHTAVKIAPHYSGVVIHSNDASENVGILNRLGGEHRESYLAQVRERQQNLRDQFEGRTPKKHISLEEARQNRYTKPLELIEVPNQTTQVVFKDYPIEALVDYIDWRFFLYAWEIKGSYPEVLNLPEKGEEARKLLADAKEMLNKIAKEKLLKLNGVVGVFPAHSEGDDIVLQKQNGEEYRFAQLRNQEEINDKQTSEKDNLAQYNLSLADFVTPKKIKIQDYLGAFALTSGIGLAQLREEYRRQGDEYSAIMAKLIADRLAEAFAQVLHAFTRQVLWGFEKEGALTAEEMIKGHYQGLRVAFGYSSSPDHSLKKELFELLSVTEQTSMRITENYMIDPGESICGLIFSSPEMRYFSVGEIDDNQLQDYAKRRNMDPEKIASLISKHLINY